MKVIISGVLLLSFAIGNARAADEKLDAKTLVGEWQIKFVTGKNNDTTPKSIVFNADSTYLWTIAGTKMEGSYKLNGTTIELTPKGQTGAVLWKDLSIKDGKIIQPIGKESRNELTRVKK